MSSHAKVSPSHAKISPSHAKVSHINRKISHPVAIYFPVTRELKGRERSFLSVVNRAIPSHVMITQTFKLIRTRKMKKISPQIA